MELRSGKVVEYRKVEKRSKSFGDIQNGNSVHEHPFKAVSLSTSAAPVPIFSLEFPMDPNSIQEIMKLVRAKYAGLALTEKDQIVEITSKRFEMWLKQRLGVQILEDSGGPSSNSTGSSSSSPNKNEDYCQYPSNGRIGGIRRCLSVPPVCQGTKYPVNVSSAVENFLSTGVVAGKSPRFSVPNASALKEFRFSFDSLSSAGDKLGADEVAALDISEDDEEVFVEEQSKTSELHEDTEVAGFSKAGRNI